MKTKPSLFNQHRVLVCMGPGGVGKTSVAAALGLAAAQSGQKVLVLTIDPSQSLARVLNLPAHQLEDDRLKRKNVKGQLFAACVEAQSVFGRFLYAQSSKSSSGGPEVPRQEQGKAQHTKHAPVSAPAPDQNPAPAPNQASYQNLNQAHKIQNNRIYRQLITRLKGLEDLSALIRLVEAIEGQKYDLIVLDTPPMQHSIDFLSAPAKFEKLFSSPLVKLLQKGGSNAAVQALSRITGSQFINELADLFKALQNIRPQIVQHSQKAQQILSQQTTAFVLVSSLDEIKLQQIDQLDTHLRQQGYQAKALILNRGFNFATTPKSSPKRDAEALKRGAKVPKVGAELKKGDAAHLSKNFETLAGQFAHYHQQQLENLHQNNLFRSKNAHIIYLPDLGHDINALKDLTQLANLLASHID